MLKILGECDDVVRLINDLLIYGKTDEEHHRQPVTVLGKLKREGVTLNKEKCQLYATEISFLGHIVNEKGVSPYPEKTRAIIQNVPRPTNVSKTRHFLGMLN